MTPDVPKRGDQRNIGNNWDFAINVNELLKNLLRQAIFLEGKLQNSFYELKLF